MHELLEDNLSDGLDPNINLVKYHIVRPFLLQLHQQWGLDSNPDRFHYPVKIVCAFIWSEVMELRKPAGDETTENLYIPIGCGIIATNWIQDSAIPTILALQSKPDFWGARNGMMEFWWYYVLLKSFCVQTLASIDYCYRLLNDPGRGRFAFV